MERVQLHEILGRQVVELEPPYRFDDVFVYLMHEGPSVRLIPDNTDGRRLLRRLRREFFRDDAGAEQSKDFGVDQFPLTPEELTDDPTGRAREWRPAIERQIGNACIMPDVACYIIRRRGGKRWWDLNRRFPNVQFHLTDSVIRRLYYTAYAMGGPAETLRRIDTFVEHYAVRAKTPRDPAFLADGSRVRAALERGGTSLFPLEIETAHSASALGHSIITSRLRACQPMAYDVNVIPYHTRRHATARQRHARHRAPPPIQRIAREVA
jgi:hypothetical protein